MDAPEISHEQGHRAAQLVEAARESRRPRLSVREAARRAGISPGWWSQLVKGEQLRGEAGTFPVKGKVETYLDMARVVGVVEEVRKVLALPEGYVVDTNPFTDSAERQIWELDLSEDRRRELIAYLRTRRQMEQDDTRRDVEQDHETRRTGS